MDEETEVYLRKHIKGLEQNVAVLKKEFKEITGKDYDKKEKDTEFAMDKVLKRIYAKTKNAVVTDNEFKVIATECGYDIRGASALFKKHLVKMAWNRVGLTQEGQAYVENLR